MKFTISPQVEQVHFPPISEVKSWIAGRSFPAEAPLIDLCQAVPDYPPAKELTDHLATLLEDPLLSRYSPDEGLPEVREAICARYRVRYGACIDPGQLCLSIGASQAFWLAMMVLCRAGDEVVIQTPYYFDHAMALDSLGICSRYVPFDAAAGGQPCVETIAALITPRTRALLLVTPSNPTGAVTPPETIGRLYQLARQRGIALVLDETYNEFIDPRPHELFSDPRWGEHFVHLASFGKTYALTGYRAGMLAASADFIHHALKIQDSMAVCQPRITQHAVRYGVEHLEAWVAGNRLMMQRRHDRFKAAFTEPGNLFTLIASGGFFAWVRHPFPGQSGRQVARRLAEEAGLICLPGEVFGPGLENYLRLAFGNIQEGMIPAAVARMRNFGRC